MEKLPFEWKDVVVKLRGETIMSTDATKCLNCGCPVHEFEDNKKGCDNCKAIFNVNIDEDGMQMMVRNKKD